MPNVRECRQAAIMLERSAARKDELRMSDLKLFRFWLIWAGWMNSHGEMTESLRNAAWALNQVLIDRLFPPKQMEATEVRNLKLYLQVIIILMPEAEVFFGQDCITAARQAIAERKQRKQAA